MHTGHAQIKSSSTTIPEYKINLQEVVICVFTTIDHIYVVRNNDG